MERKILDQIYFLNFLRWTLKTWVPRVPDKHIEEITKRTEENIIILSILMTSAEIAIVALANRNNIAINVGTLKILNPNFSFLR